MNNDWMAPTGVGLIASIGGWLLAWRVNDAKAEAALENMRAEFKELKDDFRGGMSEIRALADATGRLQSSQNVVNAVQAKAFEAVVAKQDQHSEKISDQGSAIKILSEMVSMLRTRVEELNKRLETQATAVPTSHA